MNKELMLSALHRVLDADDVQGVLDMYGTLLDSYRAGYRRALNDTDAPTGYYPVLDLHRDDQPSDRGYDEQLEFDFG